MSEQICWAIVIFAALVAVAVVAREIRATDSFIRNGVRRAAEDYERSTEYRKDGTPPADSE